MKKQRIVGLLLLAALIVPMWINELAFAANPTIPPAWYQTLPASKRFELVMNDEAVLDKETGLVWERSPRTQKMTWYTAIFNSYTKEVGGRKGWRLPTVEELASLVDTTQSNPTLPAGHPFLNVQLDWYWSATTDADSASRAWFVVFNDGDVLIFDKSNDAYMWCVRGGHGYDGGHEPHP